MRTESYNLDIDGAEFKKQRAILGRLLMRDCELNLSEGYVIDALEGLQALCDEIADQAHDNYGLDTLNDGEEV